MIWNFLRKLKIELPYNQGIPFLSIFLKKTNNKFTLALFTIAKIWKQPKCPSTDDMDKKDLIYLYHGILLIHKDEWNLAIFDNVDEPSGYYGN